MVTNVLPEQKEERVTKLQDFDRENGSETTGNSRKLARTARLQLVLPENSVDRLEALKEATEATSFAEVIRRALRIYEGLLAESEAGGVVYVRRSDDKEEIVPLHRAL